MKLIVGLGNPGVSYSRTRHNIGFLVIKSITSRRTTKFTPDSGISSLSAKVKVDSQEVLLAMPTTFMNLSGRAVAGLVKKYKIAPQNLLIVCDDLNLELGRLRLRPGGSSGGHKGLKSIIDSLERNDFPRLRVGIGRPLKARADLSEYVLGPFGRRQKEQLSLMLKEASDCCRAWLTGEIENCMNNFNS